MYNKSELLLHSIQYRIYIHRCRYKALQDFDGFNLHKQHELELIIKLTNLHKFCQLLTTKDEVKLIKKMLYQIYIS